MRHEHVQQDDKVLALFLQCRIALGLATSPAWRRTDANVWETVGHGGVATKNSGGRSVCGGALHVWRAGERQTRLTRRARHTGESHRAGAEKDGANVRQAGERPRV